MDLNYSSEELAFRDDVRGWLGANIPADLREKVLNYEELGKDDLVRWHKILVFEQLDCYEAINLDGGGSSCLLVNGKETIKPSDPTGQRPVPAIFYVK